ncbi:hypothetical protein QBC46DRAFT_458524 [Diplogelasinospora grovesii]|uniref:Uncharacterized protein n=1 Tax=Diplogelasinospora grovesii TaxID=303347 RepID=A0AAN6S5I4_9PEZI|nr:hypothetical protein QBC46DRAFT_458524 [Diplogelasinospora grovesii]
MEARFLSIGRRHGPENHMGLAPQCGICADTILRHERVVAFWGGDLSYAGQTRPFAFPAPKYVGTYVDGLLLCRYEDCVHCAASVEFTPVHHECYEITKKNFATENIEELRRPWRGSQSTNLDISSGRLDRGWLSRVVQLYPGLTLLSKLNRLPTEILAIIEGYSRHATLWRYISVLHVACQLSGTDSVPLLTVPLCDIFSWERHGKLELVTSQTISPSPTLRLTLDFDGICRVERLQRWPRYSGETSDRLAYIVEGAGAQYGEVAQLAQLKNGLLRLPLPSSRWSKLRYWNTPAPPGLDSCVGYPFGDVGRDRFYAVDLDKIRGITFFFAKGRLFGIHIHHSKWTCALSTYDRLVNTQNWEGGYVWIYLPITRDNQVLSLGTRDARLHTGSGEASRSVLVRTRLEGDLIIGRQGSSTRGTIRDARYSKSTPITMVYSDESKKPFSAEHPGINPLKESDAYFSWAPLDGVVSALTFYDQRTGLCRGIVFHYENGGARAVGQCRLHVDPAVRVLRPLRICFQAELLAYQGTRVKFHDRDEHESGDENECSWECRPLVGYMTFWFAGEVSSQLRVVPKGRLPVLRNKW